MVPSILVRRFVQPSYNGTLVIHSLLHGPTPFVRWVGNESLWILYMRKNRLRPIILENGYRLVI
jgi:hypothetical protein